MVEHSAEPTHKFALATILVVQALPLSSIWEYLPAMAALQRCFGQLAQEVHKRPGAFVVGEGDRQPAGELVRTIGSLPPAREGHTEEPPLDRRGDAGSLRWHRQGVYDVLETP